jgi:hypothetical protein
MIRLWYIERLFSVETRVSGLFSARLTNLTLTYYIRETQNLKINRTFARVRVFFFNVQNSRSVVCWAVNLAMFQQKISPTESPLPSPFSIARHPWKHARYNWGTPFVRQCSIPRTWLLRCRTSPFPVLPCSSAGQFVNGHPRLPCKHGRRNPHLVASPISPRYRSANFYTLSGSTLVLWQL